MKSLTVIILMCIATGLFAQSDSLTQRNRQAGGKPGRGAGDLYRAMQYRLEKLDNIFSEKLPGADRRKARAIIDELFLDLENLQRMQPPMPPPVPQPFAMSEKDFREFLTAFRRESFDSDKKEMLRIAAHTQCFTIEQVKVLLKEFTMSSDKIEAVRLVYPGVVDQYNAYKLINAFTFLSDKEEIRKIIEQYEERK